MIALISTIILIFSLTAFAAEQQPPPPPERPGSHDRSYYDPKGHGTFKDKLSVLEGRLKLESEDKNEIRGVFISGREEVTFMSVQPKETQRVKVNAELRGLILNSDIDFSKEDAKFDGDVTKERSAKTMTDEDRALLISTLRAVEDRRRTKEMPLTPTWEALEKSLAVWSEWPNNVSLSQTVSTRKNKSLCDDASCVTASGPSYFGPCVKYSYYEYAQHDCEDRDFSNPENQQQVSLGAHTTCPGEEWYWDGSKWECGEPDHWTRPYVQGNCFGRCGPGCGMIGTYTSDCTNHDGCVRNGHGIAALDCNDQFVVCIDDTLFSEKCYLRAP